jgi:hypothetical protein
MDSPYTALGFRHLAYMENKYGIRIYPGHPGDDDWCVVIPKSLVKKRHANYPCDNSYAVYLITESEALKIAEDWTNFAKGLEV